MNVNFGLTFDTTMSKKKKWTGMFVCLKACSLQLISILLFKTKTNDIQLRDPEDCILVYMTLK